MPLKKMPETDTTELEPAYTYKWTDAEQTTLKRTDSDGNIALVPTDPLNSGYIEFLASGAEAAPYVAPEPLPEPTTQEKVDRLLADYGLTRAELRATLEAN